MKNDAAFKGPTEDNAYTVYEINLKDWFTMGETDGWTNVMEEVDGNNYLGKTSGWKNPYEGTNAAVTVADGAVLAGEFVIPFDKDETLNTFELQLMGKKKGTDTNDDTVTTCTKSVSVAVATIPTNQALTRINHSRWINPKSW